MRREEQRMVEIINSADETTYLNHVKLNIELKRHELDAIIKNPTQAGTTFHAAGAIRRAHENRELPDPNSPYFTRVDLDDGEILYYGFASLTEANSSPPIPISHSGVSRYLTYHRNQDGQGFSVLPLEDFSGRVIRRITFLIKNGKIEKLSEVNLKSKKSKDLEVREADLLRDVMAETRDTKLQPVGGTLQADQFKLTRAASDSILAIQGPPGSGKTIVLLERLSRIAFKDRTVKEKGMVLIGPNNQFLEYVREALDILGNEEIITSTVEELATWKFTETEEAESILEIKGDSEIEQVCLRLVADLPQILNNDYEFTVENITVTFSVIESFDLIAKIDLSKINYSLVRDRISNLIINILSEKFFKDWESSGKERNRFMGDPGSIIQQQSTFKTLMRNLLPEMTAENALKKLKNSASDFLKYSEFILTEEQRRSWLKQVIPSKYEIEKADIPVLDFLNYKLKGNSGSTWGHIAIDEAQDLTPMQHRMLARRVANATSISLTGDLAQATGTFFYETWHAISENYDLATELVLEELQRSYRVPSEILNYATQFLELAAVDVNGAEPFLQIENSLELLVQKKDQEDSSLLDDLIQRHLLSEQSVLLICDKRTEEIYSKKTFSLSGKSHFKTYLAMDVKGLEFDVVIIFRPYNILNDLNLEQSHAARLFYVLSTRSTKKLYVIGKTQKEAKFPIAHLSELDSGQDDDRAAEIVEEFEDIEGFLTGTFAKAVSENKTSRFDIDFIPYSLKEVCSEINIEISNLDPVFENDAWFYLGLTQVRCELCGAKPQHVFKAHTRQNSHVTALVCDRCRAPVGESEILLEHIERIDDELDFVKNQSITCRYC
jgi:DNA helicase IV